MALISVGVDHQRQVRLRGTLALIAVIWSASDVGYYLGLPAVGLRLDYNAAPITIAFYYAFWVAFTGITFWPVYRQWQPFENRWSGYVLLALAVIGMGAFAAYVLPMLPPIDWPEAWESPDTGTLVAPKVVVTTATCLHPRGSPAQPVDVHLSAGIDKGIAAAHAVAERIVVAPSFPPGQWRRDEAATNWAVIVLKEGLPQRPVPVKAIEEVAPDRLGSLMQVGYSAGRAALPSVVRDCRIGAPPRYGAFPYNCLTELALLGAPLFVTIGGVPTLVGIGSGVELEPEPIERRPLAASASQFQQAISDASRHEARFDQAQ